MSTNATISLVNDDKSVDQIYLHWDGYVEGAGKTLIENYTDAEKVRELIELGNLSSLGAEIGEKHDFDKRPDNVCTAYRRDRGERGTSAQRFHTYSEWKRGRREQYNYLFDNGEWFVSKSNLRFHPLADKV